METEEYPDYLIDLMRELSPAEFLRITLKKLDEMKIETDEDVLLLDAVFLKAAAMSKEIKLKKLKPEYKAKFYKLIEELKLNKISFLSVKKLPEIPAEPALKSKDPELSRKRELSDPSSSKDGHFRNSSPSRKSNKNRSTSSSSSSSSSDSEERLDIQRKANTGKEGAHPEIIPNITSRWTDDKADDGDRQHSKLVEEFLEKQRGRPLHKYNPSKDDSRSGGVSRTIRMDTPGRSSSGAYPSEREGSKRSDDSYRSRHSPDIDLGNPPKTPSYNRHSPDIDLGITGRSDRNYDQLRKKWGSDKEYSRRQYRPY